MSLISRALCWALAVLLFALNSPAGCQANNAKFLIADDVLVMTLDTSECGQVILIFADCDAHAII